MFIYIDMLLQKHVSIYLNPYQDDQRSYTLDHLELYINQNIISKIKIIVTVLINVFQLMSVNKSATYLHVSASQIYHLYAFAKCFPVVFAVSN